MTNSARLIRGGLSRAETDALNAEAWQVRRTRPARALELSRLTHARSEETSYRRGVGQALVVEGFLAHEQDRIDTALSRCLSALTDLEPDGPTTWLAWAHMIIGHVAKSIEEHDRAGSHYALALSAAEAAGDAEAAASARLNAALNVPEPRRQLDELRAVASVFEALGQPLGIAYARFNLAECLYENERYDEAREVADRATHGAGRGFDGVRLLAAAVQARCLHAGGRTSQAVALLAPAIDALPDADVAARAEAARLLADLRRRTGDLEGAIAALAGLRDRLPSPSTARIDTLQMLADLHAETGSFEAAYATLRELQDERLETAAERTRRRTAILEIFYRCGDEPGELPDAVVADLGAERRSDPEAPAVVLRDDLTGLPNARRLDRELASVASSTGPRPVCLALIDIDELSLVNAELGHLVGDAALRQVAQVLEESLDDDHALLVRVDGEDFALLLDGIGIDAATALCERLRRTVERHPLTAELRGRRFTVSIGVAEARTPFDSVRLVRLADDALYEAKDAGRNRVVTRTRDTAAAHGPA